MNDHPPIEPEVTSEASYEKTLSALEIFVRHVSFLFAISLLFILPSALYWFHGIEGLVGALIVLFVTSPISIDILRNKAPLNFRALGKSIVRVGKIRLLHYLSLVILNVILFLFFGLKTLLTLNEFGLLFFAGTMAGLCLIILFPSLQTRFNRQLVCFGVAPLVINLLLILNYTNSSNPYEERYFFTHNREFYRKGSSLSATKQENTFITLENNAYADYPALRLFLDYEELEDSNHIRYTFEQGLFGVTVLKSYTFE